MQFFYAPHAAEGKNIVLDRDESKHMLKVLRKKKGDEVDVVDGKGNLFHTEIISDHAGCELQIISVEKNFGIRNFKLAVAIALPKNTDRLEWFLEKATEIGIDEIFPMITQRSERRKLNVERLEKILVSAMKQSAKAYLPKLHEPQKFEKIIAEFSSSEVEKFIAVCDLPQERHVKNIYTKGKDAMILIGPEGDFTPEEVQLAGEKKFQPISLGSSRLRVETAGVVACAAINLLNE